jgi:hypothetical protein
MLVTANRKNGEDVHFTESQRIYSTDTLAQGLSLLCRGLINQTNNAAILGCAPRVLSSYIVPSKDSAFHFAEHQSQKWIYGWLRAKGIAFFL